MPTTKTKKRDELPRAHCADCGTLDYFVVCKDCGPLCKECAEVYICEDCGFGTCEECQRDYNMKCGGGCDKN